MQSLSHNKELNCDLVLMRDKTALPAIPTTSSCDVDLLTPACPPLTSTKAAPSGNTATMMSSLAPLRNIPESEKTQLALLRSRIDEQSELITILKSRSDCATEEAKVLRNLNKEMLCFRDQAAETIEKKLREYSQLEDRFEILSANHAQMIGFKDEYKIRNIELTQENERLLKANENLFSKKINQQQFEIDNLNKLLSKSAEERNEIFNKLSDTEIKYRLLEAKYDSETGALKDKLNASQSKFKDEIQKLQDEIADMNARKVDESATICKLEKDKQGLVLEVMSRGEQLQNRQKQIAHLNGDLQKSFERLREEQDMFNKVKDDFNADINVKIWKGEVEKYEDRIEEMNREFEAFRIHSNELLSKEKSLNDKLRIL